MVDRDGRSVMWIEKLTSSRTTQALQLAARFAEQRHHVLAENIANIDTPDYHRKQLDPGRFKASLAEALDRSREAGADRLELRGNAQFSTGPGGQVEVRPDVVPPENVLFHDGTNARLEQLVADTNANALSYELAMNLLRKRLDGLLRAIRGRVA